MSALQFYYFYSIFNEVLPVMDHIANINLKRTPSKIKAELEDKECSICLFNKVEAALP